MAKERLSKLQKWILIKCHKTRDRLKDFSNGLLFRQEIVRQYFSESSNKAEASTSRSVKGLALKGLIIPYTTRFIMDKIENVIKGNRPDIAMLSAQQFKQQGKAQEDWQKYINGLLKDNKPKDKLLSPAGCEGDKIKVITLTEQGILKVKSLQIQET